MSVTPKHTPIADLRAAIAAPTGDLIHLTDQQAFALLDAFEECVKALKECQSVLAIITDRNARADAGGVAVISAYAQCVAAEKSARAAISKALP